MPTFAANNPDIFEGENTVPREAEILPTGDYHAVDPAVVYLDCNNGRGLKVDIDITAATGGGGVTITISAIDASSGLLSTLLQSALLVSSGVTELVVDPRLTASANLIAQKDIPGRVAVAFVGSGTRTTLNYQASATITA